MKTNKRGGYYGQRRTLLEEAGFISCLAARSEDMVSGATCLELDKSDPPAAHQEAKKTLINSSQSSNDGDFDL